MTAPSEPIIAKHPHRFREYDVYVLGAERGDGTWSGWIEFRTAAGQRLHTEQETSQPDRDALAYWASGLEDVYLEGALGRARK